MSRKESKYSIVGDGNLEESAYCHFHTSKFIIHYKMDVQIVVSALQTLVHKTLFIKVFEWCTAVLITNCVKALSSRCILQKEKDQVA